MFLQYLWSGGVAYGETSFSTSRFVIKIFSFWTKNILFCSNMFKLDSKIWEEFYFLKNHIFQVARPVEFSRWCHCAGKCCRPGEIYALFLLFCFVFISFFVVVQVKSLLFFLFDDADKNYDPDRQLRTIIMMMIG